LLLFHQHHSCPSPLLKPHHPPNDIHFLARKRNNLETVFFI
jgi:hypothetical protein